MHSTKQKKQERKQSSVLIKERKLGRFLCKLTIIFDQTWKIEGFQTEKKRVKACKQILFIEAWDVLPSLIGTESICFHS